MKVVGDALKALGGLLMLSVISGFYGRACYESLLWAWGLLP